MCNDSDVACPFGCVDDTGVAVAFGFVHAMLMCRHHPICVARGAWHAEHSARAPQLVSSAKAGSIPHQQLSRVEALLDSTRGWASGDGVPVLDADDVRELRRLLGAAVDPPEETRASQHHRRAARAGVIAGLSVLGAAETAAASFERGVRTRLKRRRQQRVIVQAWQQQVLRGGPARAAVVAVA